MQITSTSAPAIELAHLNFSYDDLPVLRDITATIKQGDYVGIIGPNASGKTTLLKLMLGLLMPTSGNIRLFGIDSRDFRERSQIGYVPQHISATDFHFPATVEEVVTIGRTGANTPAGKRRNLLNRPTAEDRNAVTDALRIVDIEPLRHRLIAHLSGGQRQRVFIASALASQPSVLILDEPTTGIDLTTQEKFYGLLEELNKKHGLTIILVSHDLDIVTGEISEVLCLNRELVFHGSPKDFLNDPSFIEKLYGRNVKLIAHRHIH